MYMLLQEVNKVMGRSRWLETGAPVRRGPRGLMSVRYSLSPGRRSSCCPPHLLMSYCIVALPSPLSHVSHLQHVVVLTPVSLKPLPPITTGGRGGRSTDTCPLKPPNPPPRDSTPEPGNQSRTSPVENFGKTIDPHTEQWIGCGGCWDSPCSSRPAWRSGVRYRQVSGAGARSGEQGETAESFPRVRGGWWGRCVVRSAAGRRSTSPGLGSRPGAQVCVFGCGTKKKSSWFAPEESKTGLYTREEIQII